MEIQNYLNERRRFVENGLHHCLPQPTPPFEHHLEAMRYSLLAGGKRIRPILCLAAAEAIAPASDIADRLLPVACALECIHTYSLIHDDLPAMDDDELRRGKPTNHVVYGEAAAILAGDGLLTLAFELIVSASREVDCARVLEITSVIARAAGSFGMVGGQALDIAHENSSYPFEMLQTIHRSKTGALITASVEAGAIGAGADGRRREALREYGAQIGLAFQIVDDLLDATATTEQLGKSAGSDQLHGKATYPAYFGIEKTRDKARQATIAAKKALVGCGDSAAPLLALADYLATRTN